jgi:hypothetical protein
MNDRQSLKEPGFIHRFIPCGCRGSTDAAPSPWYGWRRRQSHRIGEISSAWSGAPEPSRESAGKRHAPVLSQASGRSL